MNSRVFLLGAPRSGTTFLYALLASQPNVLSMPETGFFERWAPRRLQHVVLDGQLSMVACPTGRTARRDLGASLQELAKKICSTERVKGRLFFRSYGRDYIRLLDSAAAAQRKTVWIEKTPNHLFYLDKIEQLVPNAKFIHLIRKGEDVVASCVRASIGYAQLLDKWTFCQGIPWLTAYWNTATDIHLSTLGRQNHMIVFYEDVVHDISNTLSRLFEFIGCDVSRWDCTMKLDHIVNLVEEPWKAAALTRHVATPQHVTDTLFGKDIVSWLTKHLRSYERIRATVLSTRAARN